MRCCSTSCFALLIYSTFYTILLRKIFNAQVIASVTFAFSGLSSINPQYFTQLEPKLLTFLSFKHRLSSLNICFKVFKQCVLCSFSFFYLRSLSPSLKKLTFSYILESNTYLCWNLVGSILSSECENTLLDLILAMPSRYEQFEFQLLMVFLSKNVFAIILFNNKSKYTTVLNFRDISHKGYQSNNQNSETQDIWDFRQMQKFDELNCINFDMQNSNISQNEVNISYCFEELQDLENAANQQQLQQIEMLRDKLGRCGTLLKRLQSQDKHLKTELLNLFYEKDLYGNQIRSIYQLGKNLDWQPNSLRKIKPLIQNMKQQLNSKVNKQQGHEKREHH